MSCELNNLLREIKRHTNQPNNHNLSEQGIKLLKDKIAKMQAQEDLIVSDNIITLHRERQSNDYWIIARKATDGITKGCRIKITLSDYPCNMGNIILSDDCKNYLDAVECSLDLL